MVARCLDLFVPKPTRLAWCLPCCRAGLWLGVRRRPPLSAGAAAHRYSVGYSGAVCQLQVRRCTASSDTSGSGSLAPEAWELACHASATSTIRTNRLKPVHVSDRQMPPLHTLSGTQWARRPSERPSRADREETGPQASDRNRQCAHTFASRRSRRAAVRSRCGQLGWSALVWSPHRAAARPQVPSQREACGEDDTEDRQLSPVADVEVMAGEPDDRRHDSHAHERGHDRLYCPPPDCPQAQPLAHDVEYGASSVSAIARP